MSAGAVPYGEEILDGSGVLYQYAENALDRAKKRGKNNLVFFSADDYEKNLNRIDLQEELRESVRNGFAGFHLCYQCRGQITMCAERKRFSDMNRRAGEESAQKNLSRFWSRRN